MRETERHKESGPLPRSVYTVPLNWHRDATRQAPYMTVTSLSLCLCFDAPWPGPIGPAPLTHCPAAPGFCPRMRIVPAVPFPLPECGPSLLSLPRSIPIVNTHRLRSASPVSPICSPTDTQVCFTLGAMRHRALRHCHKRRLPVVCGRRRRTSL